MNISKVDLSEHFTVTFKSTVLRHEKTTNPTPMSTMMPKFQTPNTKLLTTNPFLYWIKIGYSYEYFLDHVFGSTLMLNLTSV